MYGLVNQGFEEMVRLRWGDARWEEIRAAAGVDATYFGSHEAYPDSVTYDLVGAASRVVGEPAEALLEDFGVHWILHTAKEGYGPIMDLTGRSLPEFMMNLPNLHTRVHVAFPNLKPPEFSCHHVTDHSLVLHYRSHRAGLEPFVVGLLKGLGLRFQTPVRVTLRDPISPEVRAFLVEWQASPG